MFFFSKHSFGFATQKFSDGLSLVLLSYYLWFFIHTFQFSVRFVPPNKLLIGWFYPIKCLCLALTYLEADRHTLDFLSVLFNQYPAVFNHTDLFLFEKEQQSHKIQQGSVFIYPCVFKMSAGENVSAPSLSSGRNILL